MLFSFMQDFHYCAQFAKYAAILLCSIIQILCSIIVLNSPNMLQYYCVQFAKYAAVLLCSFHEICCSISVLNSPNMLQY